MGFWVAQSCPGCKSVWSPTGLARWSARPASTEVAAPEPHWQTPGRTEKAAGRTRRQRERSWRARPAEWVLGAAAHRGAFTLLAQLAETVRGQGGSVMLLTARATSAAEREAVLGWFQADRACEYGELAERVRGFLAEVEGNGAGQVHLCRAGRDRGRPRQPCCLARQDRGARLLPGPSRAGCGRGAGRLPCGPAGLCRNRLRQRRRLASARGQEQTCRRDALNALPPAAVPDARRTYQQSM